MDDNSKESRKKWLERRQKGIGGSDVAAIMGLSPWNTPLDVYYSKVLKLSQNDQNNLNDAAVDPKEERFKRGAIAEKNIIDNYIADRHCDVITDIDTFVHPKYPFLIGNVDAMRADDNVVIECKTVGGYPDQWQGKIPLYYKTQCAHYAMLTNAKRVDLAAMFDRWTFRIFVYERDAAFEAHILKACVNFWQNHVLKKIPPPMMKTQDSQYISAQKDSVIKANDTIISNVIQIKALQDQQQALNDQVEQIKVNVMNYMQDHEVLTDVEGNTLVTWKMTTQNRLDSKKIKEVNPKLYQQYSKASSFRTFKLK
jgi:putative phage-type endonuclease